MPDGRGKNLNYSFENVDAAYLLSQKGNVMF